MSQLALRRPGGIHTGLLAAGLWLVAAAGVQGQRFVALHVEPILEAGGGKAAWADVNGDGWVDLLAGRLWLSQQGETFEAAADSLSQGVLADFDGDGHCDAFGFDQSLWRGDGAGGMRSTSMPELGATVCRGIAVGDFDGDGRLDLYAGGYEDWDRGLTFPDRLFLHAGSVSTPAADASEQGRGEQSGDSRPLLRVAFEDGRYRARGVCAADFDEDGDLDVYVTNYRLQPNVLWRNDGRGGLQDVASELGVLATSEGFGGGHGIGSCWGDFDDDGHLDLFAGNFAHVDSRGDQPKSRFLRSTGPEGDWVFEDLGECGLPYQESYASPACADYDGDGDLDLYFTTVYGTASFGRANHPVLLRNDGGFQFTVVTEEAGLAGLPPTYQAAWADYDGDGDPDLCTAGKLYENRGPAHRSLRVDLRDQTGRGPRLPIGAQVRLPLGSRTLTRQVAAGTGEGNQDEARLHFAVGEHPGPYQLEILWPGGQRQDHRVAEAGGPPILIQRAEAESSDEGAAKH